ncbi:MAG TPA: hypothetical protein VFO05_16195 [Candidatus Limnocylindrales bacterium]|nr:hypothetical protein [Candidatus Limnocylindrales bacterium]
MTESRVLRTLALRPRWAALIAAVVFALVQAGPSAAGAGDLQGARSATARFNSLQQAVAAGYELPPGGPLHECIAAFDDSGAMGYHFINFALLDATIDPAAPEALVYAPDADGKLKLVALEYVAFQEPWIAEHGSALPSLFGEEFHTVPFPNRYEVPAFFALHAWIWETNPSGTFADFNPNVSCD